MYIDVPRRLVFFDKDDTVRPPCLVQYHPDTGTLSRPTFAQPDDSVWDIARDQRRIALSGVKWLVVRGASRSRLNLVHDGAPLHATQNLLSYWARFDPSARYALVSVANGKKRPVIIDLDSGEHSDPVERDVDARFGSIDPLQGRLWAPDERARNGVLTVDCASGEVGRVSVPLEAKVRSLRFSRDGQYLFVTGENNRLLCCDREGATVWTRDVSAYGHVGSGRILFNESGSHLCLPTSPTDSSTLAGNLIIATATGHTETTIMPKARLAADWFGDHVLSHRGEVVDFFTGAIVAKLDLASPC
ncbi:YncE family protein [Pseudomonas sp. 1176_21]|uniref:YncE family protein n=1 Tax=Pseudomonas sp. 1176_21 TaxID=2604453 RepID=UPI004063E5CC